MLATGRAMLDDARASRFAVACFTVYTLESVRAVCDAATAMQMPVMMSAGSSSFRAVGRNMLAAAALAGAREAGADVGVHLDHSTDVEEIRACLDYGYTSVMVDGSGLPFQRNVELTGLVAELAHSYGAWAEGELGGIAGDEDVSTDARAAQMTDPAQAAEFVRATGIDALAVAVGTVHGMAAVPAHVDLVRLEELRQVVSTPLVLHGASGLDDGELARAVTRGIAKVNINTELRRAYLDIARAAEGDDVRSFQHRAVVAMRQVALGKIRALRCAG